jgi:hypothetical protein
MTTNAPKDQKPVAKADPQPKTEAKAEPAPIGAGGLQPGQSVGVPITTRPPRGVDELPSDAVAEEEAAAGLQEHVQNVLKEETERGYRGYRKDKPTPNSAYTLAGVGRGDPTPETTIHTPTT